jgi:hypothetical protein
VEQRVADSDVDGEVGTDGEAVVADGAHGGEKKAEAGDGGGERVLVHAVDRGHGLEDKLVGVGGGGLGFPGGQEALEGAEEEVAGAAGGVDDAEAG